MMRLQPHLAWLVVGQLSCRLDCSSTAASGGVVRTLVDGLVPEGGLNLQCIVMYCIVLYCIDGSLLQPSKLHRL